MQLLRAALFATAAVIALPAHAGDAVLYDRQPDWVQAMEFDPATEPATEPASEQGAPATIFRDWQYRLDGGTVTSFSDAAVRLENPQSLMQEGTISLGWMPDKGDLTIHRLEIHRAGEVIDLVAQGVRFDVIRREQGLEQRLLDGQLTATLAVPGLRVGDVLRLSYSTTLRDQALGDEMQAAQYLPPAPWQVGNARVIMSWPAASDIRWAVEDRVQPDDVWESDGYTWLRVDLPLAERPAMPGDSPSRYRLPDVLRAGSFASWQELSAVMAPHFEQAAQLAAGSDVAAQAQAIMAATADPRERMALATQFVQDEVSYLLNGLDGGNYLPQTAELTLENRYGDCKAKSVLLLALLREMGLDAEVVLVTTTFGDAVPELLPLPLTFNHMIVHAVLDGQDYWLDGTSSATRLANLADVPPFFWALPLRDGGADLLAMEQRDPAQPGMALDMTIDHSAGPDFPLLFDMAMHVSGPAGAPVRAMVDAANPDMLRQIASGFSARGGLEGGYITDIAVSYDEDTAIATITASGVANSMFEWRDGRLEMDVEQGADGRGFNPDRSRAAWREIPVVTPGPNRVAFDTRLVLPNGGAGYSLSGVAEVDDGYANMRVTRHARLEDGVLLTEAEVVNRLGELPAAELPAAKRAARRLDNMTLELQTPGEFDWRWDLSAEERQLRAAPIIAAYDAAIDFAASDDYGPLQARAMFLESIYAFEEALADYTVLTEESPSPWAYHRRSAMLEALGRREEAIADLQAAYDIDPANGTAFGIARLLAYEGQTQEAGELLEYLPVADDEALTMADLQATVTGLSGDAEGGLDIIAAQVADSGSDAAALNTDCWYRGLFNIALDDAVDLCTRAVERASFAAPPLDSRALVRFRLGQLPEALADLDAALEVSPGLAPTLYLRGIVRLAAGDGEGAEDIGTALRMVPQLGEFYARHGIIPPR